MDWCLWPLAVLGHIGIWCFFFNRTHATAWSRPLRKAIEKLVIVLVFVPLGLASWFLWRSNFPAFSEWSAAIPGLTIYFSFSVAAGVWFLVAWCIRRFGSRSPNEICFSQRETIDLEQKLGMKLTDGAFANTLRLIPWNRCCWMEFSQASINLPESRKGLSGLKIAHLSDFHLTGGIRREYFDEIVRWINSQNCDLVLLTGDLIDNPDCLDWIPPVFGALRSRYGKFFVLGNHDLLIPDQTEYLCRLRAAGMRYVSGAWFAVETDRGRIGLTGNDLPWYRECRNLTGTIECDFRILLAHSPDQIGWAREQCADLMFAGHTHGGQICFPIVGPVISPSKFGVRFAAGEYKFAPTLMIVSRGISGDEPIRWNCLPQVTVWTLV